MLSFAADFWPTFWMILAGAAFVTAALCFAVAVVPVRRPAQRHHRPPVRLHPRLPAGTLPQAGMPHAA